MSQRQKGHLLLSFLMPTMHTLHVRWPHDSSTNVSAFFMQMPHDFRLGVGGHAFRMSAGGVGVGVAEYIDPKAHAKAGIDFIIWTSWFPFGGAAWAA